MPQCSMEMWLWEGSLLPEDFTWGQYLVKSTKHGDVQVWH